MYYIMGFLAVIVHSVSLPPWRCWKTHPAYLTSHPKRRHYSVNREIIHFSSLTSYSNKSLYTSRPLLTKPNRLLLLKGVKGREKSMKHAMRNLSRQKCAVVEKSDSIICETISSEQAQNSKGGLEESDFQLSDDPWMHHVWHILFFVVFFHTHTCSSHDGVVSIEEQDSLSQKWMMPRWLNMGREASFTMNVIKRAPSKG